MKQSEIDRILEVFEDLGDLFHDNANKHGFWEDIDQIDLVLRDAGYPQLAERAMVAVDCEKIALAHSELSEALEGIRKDPTKPDEHCPEFTTLEVELADEIIRVLEYGKRKNLRLGSAMLAKHAYNVSRPYKHGKKN